jgi:putative NIF3 family GTP cyclohydrolase 1 type 2
MEISRRRFSRLAGTAALAGPPLLSQGSRLTAQQVIDRIQKRAGAASQGQSADGLKAGDPATPVMGIATTGMATMDVLTRASKEKTNLVITLEPTFFGRLDGQPDPAARAGRGGGRGPAGVTTDDPVYLAKMEFLRKNGLVVWRFSNLWRGHKPDPFATGLAGVLGWTKHQVGDDVFRYDVPPVTLTALADDLAKRLKTRAGIRVIGDPQTRVRRIALLPGLSTLADAMKALPECDLLLAGEAREWESVEYAQDTVASGQKKGMILLGRVVSEEPGMSVCADWLKAEVPEVPVRWIGAGDAYWRPA